MNRSIYFFRRSVANPCTDRRSISDDGSRLRDLTCDRFRAPRADMERGSLSSSGDVVYPSSDRPTCSVDEHRQFAPAHHPVTLTHWPVTGSASQLSCWRGGCPASTHRQGGTADGRATFRQTAEFDSPTRRVPRAHDRRRRMALCSGPQQASRKSRQGCGASHRRCWRSSGDRDGGEGQEERPDTKTCP